MTILQCIYTNVYIYIHVHVIRMYMYMYIHFMLEGICICTVEGLMSSLS